MRDIFSGELMTFRKTGCDSDGDFIEIDLELRRFGAPGGAPHRHIVAERFTITGGRLWVWVGSFKPRVVGVGDVITVPPLRWHFVLALRRSRASVRIEPAMRFDELLVDWAALGRGDFRPSVLRRVLPLLRAHQCISGPAKAAGQGNREAGCR